METPMLIGTLISQNEEDKGYTFVTCSNLTPHHQHRKESEQSKCQNECKKSHIQKTINFQFSHITFHISLFAFLANSNSASGKWQ